MSIITNQPDYLFFSFDIANLSVQVLFIITSNREWKGVKVNSEILNHKA